LKLVGTDEETIYYNFKELFENQKVYDAMVKNNNPYGDSKDYIKIVDIGGKEFTEI